MGGGGGVLNISFILFLINEKWNHPFPRINDELPPQPMRGIFSTIEMGLGVVLIFHLFCLRL